MTRAFNPTHEKLFETFRAKLALSGFALYRSASADEPEVFWVERFGVGQHMTTVDAIRRFVDKVGGEL